MKTNLTNDFEWLLQEESKEFIKAKPTVTECATLIINLKNKIKSIEEITNTNAPILHEKQLTFLKQRLKYWQDEIANQEWLTPEEDNRILREKKQNNSAIISASDFIPDNTFRFGKRRPKSHFVPSNDPRRETIEYIINSSVDIFRYEKYARGSLICRRDALPKSFPFGIHEHNTQAILVLSNGLTLVGRIIYYQAIEGILFPPELFPKGFLLPPVRMSVSVQVTKIIIG